jgi:hypothetical protein
MRIVGPALVLLVALVTPGTAPAAGAGACQRRIGASSAKFAQAALKIGQACAMRAARGGLACRIASATGSGDRATDEGLRRAAARLAARVGDACEGADLAAFARRCPDPTGPPLSVAELVACLRATHLDRVGSMLAVEFPVATATAADSIDGCTAPQVCQCRCASPSGAFVTAGDGDVR